MYQAFVVRHDSFGVEGSTWLRILHHNATNKNLFSNDREAKFSMKKGKFSVLGKITDEFKINGVFEYVLEYPQTTGIKHWNQTVNPIHAQPFTDIGFHIIKSTLNDLEFGGLALSSQPSNSLLDGMVNHSNWYYAVGAYANWAGNNSIPGPTGGTWSCWSTVNLYLKIENEQLLENLIFPFGCSNKKHSNWIHIKFMFCLISFSLS